MDGESRKQDWVEGEGELSGLNKDLGVSHSS